MSIEESYAEDDRVYRRALCATALSYAVCHHLGLLPSGLGVAPNGTRWADWLDLAVPWLVLVPAAVTLWAAGDVSASVWAVFGAGVVAYTSGHGIHLAANSVGNIDPGETAHLWDEVVGHYIWYSGVALVLSALAISMIRRGRSSAVGHAVGVGAGLTWATNAIGGGTVVLSLLVALAAVVFGWRHRAGLPAVLVVGFAPAVVVLVGDLILAAT